MTSAFGDMVPPHKRPSCTPEAIYERVYGVIPGEWACPECGTVWDVARYPSPLCGCGRPLPERCSSSGCTEVVQPEPVRSADGVIVDWDRPRARCRWCIQVHDRAQREAEVEAQIPPELLATSTGAFRSYQWRRPLVDALAAWLEHQARGGKPCLYVWGNTGSGKTVAIARAASSAIVERRIARSLVWIREHELVDAAKRSFSREVGEDARRTLRRAEEAEILVVDELFSRVGDGYTDHVRETLGELFRVRFERRAPTLITSNEALGDAPTMWTRVLDSRVDSRWRAVGVEVACNGPDLRAAA